MLVMLAPAIGPMAMLCAARPQAMHCMRQPISGQALSGHPEQPPMHCHHAMAQSKPPQPESSQGESSEISFQAVDSCCQNHCCCGATSSEWARSASGSLSLFYLLIESAHPAQSAVLYSSAISNQYSARAPPRN